MSTPPKSDAARILLADDDDALRQVLARSLTAGGYEVHTASNGDEAVGAFEGRTFDVVLSDIDMPGKNGIELLKAIRARDLDIPVVLLTGAPRLETAISAVEYGATQYLTKPVDLTLLAQTLGRAVQTSRLARARRNLVGLAGNAGHQIADIAGLTVRFENALATAFMHCQPIVRWSDRSTFAYEALVRGSEPTIPNPDALFDAAERLDRIVDVGRRIRAILPTEAPTGLPLFVNLHPRDLSDDSLYELGTRLSAMADRVVLEITERARLETIADVRRRVDRLREMGFGIAIDDIGAGYAGLTSFAALEPNFMKLDKALVEGIAESRTKMRLVGAMIQACTDLGVQVIGEGIEKASERDVLVELGCDLLQGYLFARPDEPFVDPIL